jgi:hypothetical protein
VYAWAIEKMSTEDAEKWEALLAAPTSDADDYYDDDDFTTGASVITAEGSIF